MSDLVACPECSQVGLAPNVCEVCGHRWYAPRSEDAAPLDRTCCAVPDGTWCATHDARWTTGTNRCVRSGWAPALATPAPKEAEPR